MSGSTGNTLRLSRLLADANKYATRATGERNPFGMLTVVGELSSDPAARNQFFRAALSKQGVEGLVLKPKSPSRAAASYEEEPIC